jgi:hypothetical protein
MLRAHVLLGRDVFDVFFQVRPVSTLTDGT